MQAQLSVSRPTARLGLQQPARTAARAVFSSSKAAPRSSRQLAVAPAAVAAPEAPASASSKQPEPSFGVPADTYAVVEIGGHQMVVEEGRWYTVNRLEAEPGSTIQLGRVLALKSGGEFKVGRPYLEATVEAEVMEELKAPKVIVYKMKPKKHYRKMNGHRQPLTKLLITKIA